MSFASSAFLLAFLPVVLMGFHLIGGERAATWRARWLLASSLVFYASAGALGAATLALSLAFNFLMSRLLCAAASAGRKSKLLPVSITFNVLLLLAFKALASRADGASYLVGEGILIPLGLSFVTFQQIAFLTDCSRGRVEPPGLRDYLLFIAFFPQLVMGPIVHYRQLAPQFGSARLALRSAENVCVGLAIFAVGLFKKLVIADSLAPGVDRVFAAAASGELNPIDAWGGAVGFQLQMFLDFSGYADMAIGLARMFNLDLPINFDDPYHATSRFDLWRRWHLTFVEFMREHVFQPLARLPWLPVWGAVMVTGLVSGLWHGLGWTFALWGLVQGAVLLLSHIWSRWRRHGPFRRIPKVRALQIATTFAVTASLGVLFRASSLAAAERIGRAALSLDALALPVGVPWLLGDLMGKTLVAAPDLALQLTDAIPFLAAVVIVWLLPQTRALFARHWTALDPRPARLRPALRTAPPWLQFELSVRWGLLVALLLVASLLSLDTSRRFVYFQF